MSKSKLTEDESIVMNRLAVVLKEERLTNRALASKIGYKETTISKWATNAVQPPVATFLRIALILNRDFKDFFISSRDLSDIDKRKYLEALAEMGEKGKRTGKNKG